MAQAPNLPARFANRANRRQLATAVTAGLGMSSPPYISIKGNQFALVDAAGVQEPVETKHLDCVIFDVNLEVPTQRVFWGVAYNPSAEAQAPLCFSDNGIGASRNAAEPQSPNCSSCKQNEWGSATSKVTGKPVMACSVLKKVAVLVPGWEFPFLLRVPVMSHENLRVYGDKFKGQEFDVSEVITRITFVHGKTGVLDFAATGFTDDETEALISKLLADKATDNLIGRGDVPVSAELPAPKPLAQLATAAQQAADVMTQRPPAPAPQAAPFAAATPAEPAKKGRSKAAAAPAQAPADDGLPPFLRRAEATPASSAPQSGIVTGAPPPNKDLEAALANVFGLPTGE